MRGQTAVAAVVVAGLAASVAAQFDSCFSEPGGSAQRGSDVFNFTGVDAFGLSLFGRLGQAATGNLVMSPYSVWSALSLALMGAGGSTRRQLEGVLNMPRSKWEAYRMKFALNFVLSHLGSGVNGMPKLLTFDKAYFDVSRDVRPCVSQTIHNVDILDFKKSGEAANIVNSDVSTATAGIIPQLVDAGNMANAAFVLVNAVYFQGKWESQFDPSMTTPMVFYNARGEHVATAQMMQQTGRFKIAKSLDLKATVLELPYRNSNMSMIILLPDVESPDVGDTLAALTPARLDRALSVAAHQPVKVFLPKFDLKDRQERELVQALQNMGLRDMFNPSRSNFDDFTSRKPMFVDTVIHQAAITVDEEGTTAAASTGVAGTRFGAELFAVNRPFIFLVYATDLRLSMFAGVVRDPSA